MGHSGGPRQLPRQDVVEAHVVFAQPSQSVGRPLRVEHLAPVQFRQGQVHFQRRQTVDPRSRRVVRHLMELRRDHPPGAHHLLRPGHPGQVAGEDHLQKAPDLWRIAASDSDADVAGYTLGICSARLELPHHGEQGEHVDRAARLVRLVAPHRDCLSCLQVGHRHRHLDPTHLPAVGLDLFRQLVAQGEHLRRDARVLGDDRRLRGRRRRSRRSRGRCRHWRGNQRGRRYGHHRRRHHGRFLFRRSGPGCRRHRVARRGRRTISRRQQQHSAHAQTKNCQHRAPGQLPDPRPRLSSACGPAFFRRHHHLWRRRLPYAPPLVQTQGSPQE